MPRPSKFNHKKNINVGKVVLKLNPNSEDTNLLKFNITRNQKKFVIPSPCFENSFNFDMNEVTRLDKKISELRSSPLRKKVYKEFLTAKSDKEKLLSKLNFSYTFDKSNDIASFRKKFNLLLEQTIRCIENEKKIKIINCVEPDLKILTKLTEIIVLLKLKNGPRIRKKIRSNYELFKMTQGKKVRAKLLILPTFKITITKKLTGNEYRFTVNNDVVGLDLEVL